MQYTLEELQKLDNNFLFKLVLQTGVKKVNTFPVNWKEFERNCIITRLARYYEAINPTAVKTLPEESPEPAGSVSFHAIIECLKEKSPNNGLLLKNVKNWTLKDLEYAKTFL